MAGNLATFGALGSTALGGRLLGNTGLLSAAASSPRAVRLV
ncbi:hypothetical protein [Sinorhizobium psoraleae]|uniref:Uncharacterized protein n=1 Tax=Sinorhizobium psoraleae TaxID=520838 RepID=A0ABT4KBV3_9HYPH|nr:hypothetical protein [Sinorhizobium psoraleae]MCZ4089324.1 hypothetical protein [Sinorhizobium psoraleae]